LRLQGRARPVRRKSTDGLAARGFTGGATAGKRIKDKIARRGQKLDKNSGNWTG
jgi:hypothetical protein